MKPPQDSLDFPNAFYRVTVKGLCVRDGKILLVHDYSGHSATDPGSEWELPGGGLEFGENFQDALKREVQEEMGLKVSWIDEKPTFVWTTKHSTGRWMEWYWVCSVMFRFEVEDLNFTPSIECREIKFFSKEDLQNNIADLASQVVPLAERFNPQAFEQSNRDA
ncbi:MAG TPA: NUDIX hydrolase [Candidatus Paceibacterota bacterium]